MNRKNNWCDTVWVWTTDYSEQTPTPECFNGDPEGHFNHWLFDSLRQLFSIPGKRAITLTDEWGKNGWKERTVCSAWKWKFGVEKNSLGAWLIYCICTDGPEMTSLTDATEIDSSRVQEWLCWGEENVNLFAVLPSSGWVGGLNLN